MKRNDSLHRFDYFPVLSKKPVTQSELDSVKQVILSLPFYEGLIYNSDSNATLMAITFDKEYLNSKNRITISENIQKLGDEFAKANNIELHYSGLPYIRTVFMKKVSSEMSLFLLLAVVVTSILLFLFFRSFVAVFFSIVVWYFHVIWQHRHIKSYRITSSFNRRPITDLFIHLIDRRIWI